MSEPPHRYQVGDLAQAYVLFEDADHAAVDPTTVTLKYLSGESATLTTVTLAGAEVVRDGLGRYHYDINVTEPGTWAYKWFGTGAAQAADERTFVVAPTAF